MGQSTQLFSTLVESHPTDRRYATNLASSQLLQLDVNLTLGEDEIKLTLCETTRDQLASIIATNKSPNYTIPYAKSLACLGLLESHPELISLLIKSGVKVSNL